MRGPKTREILVETTTDWRPVVPRPQMARRTEHGHAVLTLEHDGRWSISVWRFSPSYYPAATDTAGHLPEAMRLADAMLQGLAVQAPSSISHNVTPGGRLECGLQPTTPTIVATVEPATCPDCVKASAA